MEITLFNGNLKPKLGSRKILSAIRELLRKVEPLRVSFSEIDGEWYQKVNELDDFGLNQLIKFLTLVTIATQIIL